MKQEIKIAWFTEGEFQGKIPRNFRGMRTDSAWMCVLNACHYSIWNISQVTEKYDLGILIIPKKNVDKLSKHNLIENLRKCCDKIAIMQEGPSWYFQDFSLFEQAWYFNMLQEVDYLYVHNINDKKYYDGLTNKKCKLMPSLMIEDLICNLPKVERDNVIIGGNFCSWYGGFDSYIVSQDFEKPIWLPSMGRRIQLEEQMPNINHFSYMDWVDWIYTLNKFKYGVHLMRTHAAGTFALNCAYLGIPCIGYKGLDTQEICHPNLTIDIGDLVEAKKIVTLLKNEHDYYDFQSKLAKENYNKFYTEQIFKQNFYNTLK